MSERETALKAVRLKAIKLLEALAERCERPEDEDHDWHTCRSCVAAFSLTQPGEKSLLRLLLDELMAAGADPVPVCQWREIATAPKDRWVWFGRPASDCKRKFTISPYRWDESHGMWFSGTGWWGSAESIFTHWCEMREQPPAPPVGPAEGDR